MKSNSVCGINRNHRIVSVDCFVLGFFWHLNRLHLTQKMDLNHTALVSYGSEINAQHIREEECRLTVVWSREEGFSCSGQRSLILLPVDGCPLVGRDGTAWRRETGCVS